MTVLMMSIAQVFLVLFAVKLLLEEVASDTSSYILSCEPLFLFGWLP